MADANPTHPARPEPIALDAAHRRRAVHWLLVQGRPVWAAKPPADGWQYLEAAHVLGQPDCRLHAQAHWAMLRCAVVQWDLREVAGQVLRLALVPPGHALARLPIGNTGRARVSPVRHMPVAPHTAALIAQALQSTGTR